MLKTRTSKLKGFILISFVFLWAVVSVNAAPFTVTKAADTNDGICDVDCSFREAVDASNQQASNDTIDFAPAISVIALTQPLSLNNNGTLLITGPGASLLKISGNNQTRIFTLGSGSAVSITGLTIADGNGFAGPPPNSGGAILIQTGASLSLTNVVLRNNFASVDQASDVGLVLGGGGAVYNRGNLVLMQSVVTQNSVTSIGARAFGGGGGIYNLGTTQLIDSSVDGNQAISVNGGRSLGGGLYNAAGTLTLTGSTISGNINQGNGGGINNGNATVNITNSTISGNSAVGLSGVGGGLINSGFVRIDNSTVAGNTAESGGGGVSSFPTTGSGDFTSRNTIYGDNSTPYTSDDFEGTFNSEGYNFLETTATVTFTGTTTGNILNVDPQLLPLGNYGGPTQTVALLGTSPAIDAADPNSFPATDQRGVARPQDGDLNGSALPDIGAYERQVTVFNVTKTADTNDGVCDADCSLREAVSKTNTATTRDNAIIFDPSVFAAPQTITLTSGQLIIQNNGNLHIKGTGADLLSISGNDQSRIFQFNEGTKSAVEGVTVTDGLEGSSGGIVQLGGTILVINDSVITRNTAGTGGGGGVSNNGGLLTINDSTISNNVAYGKGGGFHGYGTNTFNNVVFANNTAMQDGGGIYIAAGLTFINNSKIINNKSPSQSITAYNGGGIAFEGQMLTINSSTISNNLCRTGFGGGIFNRSTAIITNSAINGNTAQNGGGIASLQAQSLSLTNSTVSGNSGLDGGGMYFGNGSSFTSSIVSSTIAVNRARRDGGGIFTSIANLNVRNTIVADNIASNSAPDYKGTMVSQGYNLIENGSGATITGATAGNITGVDPYLTPLGNYGGATPTHALRIGSPAIDKGNNFSVPTDQRGKSRPFDDPQIPNAAGGNGSDIGAFERQSIERIPGAPFDFDGDGRTDVGVWRAPSGSWWYLQSSNLTGYGHSFGLPDDIITPGDFTGDGKTDVAIWRPTTGEWFVRRSEDGSYYSYSFGLPGDIPAPADYDGDGITDTATFRPSTATWYIFNSGSGTYSILTFGLDGDKPVPADYDGDGKADIATWRASNATWWIVNSSNLQQKGYGFGLPTDRPVVGDYTGDGKADIAVWRDSTREWLFLRSNDNFISYYSYQSGLPGDIPAPGDYDGDGRFDSAVFRPSTVTWYIDGSTAGSMIATFGLNGDRPVANAFVP